MTRLRELLPAIAWLALARGVLAQPRPAFEVASVKTHRSAPGPQSSEMDDRPGGIDYSNVYLKPCILAAFNLKGFQLEGLDGPRPGLSDRYDIVAKAGRTVSHQELMAMLQTLIEDRFQLKFHSVLKTRPVYRLSAGPGRTKLQAAAESDAGSEMTAGRLASSGMSLERLADFLSQLSDLPVVDSTGISGIYRFTLHWSTGETREDLMNSLFDSVRQELGLKIEHSSMPIQTMIIDHVNAKPTEN